MVCPTNYICGLGGREYVMMTMTRTENLAMQKFCLTSEDKTICVQSFGALCNAGQSVSE
jgi:hypothetical protein